MCVYAPYGGRIRFQGLIWGSGCRIFRFGGVLGLTVRVRVDLAMVSGYGYGMAYFLASLWHIPKTCQRICHGTPNAYAR